MSESPPSLQAALHITLLGEFRLDHIGGTPLGLSAERAQSLLAYLVLHRHAPQSRSHIAFQLWPDSGESQARTNLRNLLHGLRQTLPDPDRFLTADTSMLQWRPDAPAWIDLVTFETSLDAARLLAEPAATRLHLETALACYQGGLLLGNQDEWIVPHRERLRLAYLETIDRLVGLALQQSDSRAAIQWAQQLVREDPIGENGYVQLMHLYGMAGDRAGVRRIYQACAHTLAREIGVEPSKVTQEAYQNALRLKPALRATPETGVLPLTPSMAPVSENHVRPLPMAATPLLGRSRELADIAQLLADSTCHLLSILGVGGVGKTRLALETAAAHCTLYADGIAFVPLAGLQTPETLAPAIADAVGCRYAGAADSRSQLLDYLGTRHMLIVLDNFEHLLESVDLVEGILTHAPQVKILVTSRQRLDLQEEWAYPLAGLDIAEDDHAGPEASSAMALFVQSARRINRAFVLDEENRQAIYHICRAVEGVPLALELAASWVRSLSCREIAAEIQRDLDFLQAHVRNVPERHRSMRAVFAHSWRLLAAQEQQALARLALFRGGFTREAAAQVAGAELATLTGLADKSLVRRMGNGRYTIHELLRQFALEHLSTYLDAAVFAERYATYYAGLLAAQDQVMRGPGQVEAVHALHQEMDNLRAAWHWMVTHQRADLIGQAARGLNLFAELSGLFHDGVVLLRAAESTLTAALTGMPTPDDSQAACLRRTLGQVLVYAGYLGMRAGHQRASLETLEAGVALVADDDPIALADGLMGIGFVHNRLGLFDQGIAALEQALSIARAAGSRWNEAMTGCFLGNAWYVRDEQEAAARLLQPALALCREVGDPSLVSYALACLGVVRTAQGALAQAESLLTESLAIGEELGWRWNIAFALGELSYLAEQRGETASAAALADRALSHFVEIRDHWSAARLSAQVGESRLTAGEWSEAETHFADALVIGAANDSLIIVLRALGGLAALAEARNDLTTAQELAAHVLLHPAKADRVQRRVRILLPQLFPGVDESALPERLAQVQAERSFGDVVAGQVARCLPWIQVARHFQPA